MLRLRITLPLLALLCATAFVACSDDAADPVTGFTAQGIELTSGSVIITANGQALTGDTVTVNTGSSITYSGQFITSDGQRGLPTTSDYTLRVAVADTTVATATVTGSWNVEVHGVTADGGKTSMTLTLLKNGSAVYTSPAIPIVVIGKSGLSTGDTLNYAAQQRDLNNTADPSTATTQRWVVLATGMSFQGKSDVVMFDRNDLDNTGNSVAHDTVYMQTASDGSVYLFDEIRKQFFRQGGVAAHLAASLPQLWIKVSNTLQTTAATWSDFDPDTIAVDNLTIPDAPVPVNVRMSGRATHTGRAAQTVPAGSYSDAAHTDHMLYLKVDLVFPPQTALDDSVAAHYDASQQIGLLGWTYNTKELTVGTGSETFYGQQVVLQSIRRKH